MFKGIQGELPIKDKRCKIVNIEKFYNSTHWSVERGWARKEKIELGIEEEDKIISIEEFISLIADIAGSLTEFEEPLRGLVKKSPNTLII